MAILTFTVITVSFYTTHNNTGTKNIPLEKSCALFFLHIQKHLGDDFEFLFPFTSVTPLLLESQRP